MSSSLSHGAFPEDYREARERFRDAASAAGLDLSTHPIPSAGPNGEGLSIDVAARRVPGAERALVLTSGVHGVEGPLGSAVQIAMLRDPGLLEASRPLTLALVHAVNPYGFAWSRRWNEDNIDLNRSFFADGAARPEVPELYRRLTPWLNPETPPRRPDLFPLEMLYLVGRHGFTRLKKALPIGQYEHPKALFYGGVAPTASQRALAEILPAAVGEARSIIHLDYHTGLGRRGDYKLLMGAEADPEELTALRRRFGPDRIEAAADRSTDTATSYPARGLLDLWAPSLFPGRSYRVLTAEFGTSPAIQVFRALRAENRAHHWGRPDTDHAWAKAALREAFIPRDPAWRDAVLRRGLQIVRQAAA